jgi:hypothetical protein
MVDDHGGHDHIYPCLQGDRPDNRYRLRLAPVSRMSERGQTRQIDGP